LNWAELVGAMASGSMSAATSPLSMPAQADITVCPAMIRRRNTSRWVERG
jgi:hypothetical protein